jgi:hypothetical protein
MEAGQMEVVELGKASMNNKSGKLESSISQK